jgi:hypothetical protein
MSLDLLKKLKILVIICVAGVVVSFLGSLVHDYQHRKEEARRTEAPSISLPQY